MKHCLAAVFAAVVLLSCTREEIVSVEPDSPENVSVDAGNYVCGEARVFLSEEMAALLEEAAEEGTLVTKSQGMNLALEELGITEM